MIKSSLSLVNSQHVSLHVQVFSLCVCALNVSTQHALLYLVLDS